MFNFNATFLFFESRKLWFVKEAISEKDVEFTDTRIETTEPQITGSDSSSDSDSDDLGTSASVQEEKREFEAGLSDLRHKLAQEVIVEEDEGNNIASQINDAPQPEASSRREVRLKRSGE